MTVWSFQLLAQINNAAVLHLDNTYEHAVECIDTNYYGTKNVTETLLPHLKASSAGARIVNVSSRMAWINMVRSSMPLRDLETNICIYTDHSAFLLNFPLCLA